VTVDTPEERSIPISSRDLVSSALKPSDSRTSASLSSAVGGANKVSISAGVESASVCSAQIAESFWKFSVPLTLLTVSDEDEVPVREPCGVDVCDIKVERASSHFSQNASMSIITDTYKSNRESTP